MPLFSIVVPCFNAEKTIGATLASLRAQSCADWEAICIDDGSSDATREYVKRAAKRDPRIRLASNPGKGPSEARNHGAMSLAKGNLIAFCDADDIWTPSKLDQLTTTFQDASVDAAYGRIAFFSSHPSDAKAFSTVPTSDLTIDMLLGENPVCTMSNITVRKEIITAAGGFDTTMVHNEDLEWLIRLVGNGARIVGIDHLHTWYRTSVGGLSSDLAAMFEGRVRAIATAAEFGVIPSGKSDAIHHRYLARRALRLGHDRFEPLRYAIKGVARDPVGFLFPLRRGGLTFVAALCVTVLPRATSINLFSR